MDSDKSDCLKKEEKETPQQAAKPGKKKKKKKKKSSTSAGLVEGESTSSQASELVAEKILPAACQITPEEISELNIVHSEELSPSKCGAKTSEDTKDEPQSVLDYNDVTNHDKSVSNSSSESKTKRKKTNKINNLKLTCKQALPEQKDSKLTTPENSEKLIKSDSGSNSEKEVFAGATKKPSEEKSSSPSTDRKKKKKKKAGGFLLSDVNLSEPQNDSDKEKKDVKSSEKDTTKLRDPSTPTADSSERESDFKTFSKDKSLLQSETKEK